MKIKPIHLIPSGILLIAALYFFGSTVLTDKQDAASIDAPERINNVSYNFDPFIENALLKIDSTTAKSIKNLQNQLTASSDSTQTVKLYRQLIIIWKAQGSKIVAAEYAHQLAIFTRQNSDITSAADLLIDAFETAADSSIALELGVIAYQIAKMAYDYDSTNIDNKVNYAISLIECENKVMQGVPILLSVVKKSPNHLKANFILAKFAVLSGQNDKAISRLEKIISLNPAYTNAYLLLAKAYASKGDIAKAKLTLHNCEQQLTDETAKLEMKQIIENIN